MLKFSVIPQPVYMNSQQLNGIPKDQEIVENDDDLKTPTVEDFSFPGNVEAQQKAVSRYQSVVEYYR